MLDQMKLPQRMAMVQRLHAQLRQALLQCLLLLPNGARRQRLHHQVSRQIEVDIRNPACASGVLDSALHKAGVLQQPHLHALCQILATDAGLDQPDRIDLAHAFFARSVLWWDSGDHEVVVRLELPTSGLNGAFHFEAKGTVR